MEGTLQITGRTPGSAKPGGHTLTELVVALAMGAVLIAGLGGVLGQALQVHDGVRDRNELTRQARFAMDQIVRAVGHSPHLLVPLHDDPGSMVSENIHDVLAITLDHRTDLDGDGIPDADNDGDGRFDEDPPADATFDNASGIYLIDDDADGSIDEGPDSQSDDESATPDDDPINGLDDDGDGNVDEDPPGDANADACPGVCGVDDDASGGVDGGATADDDEDGATDEDWYDAVVFYLNGSQLIQRTPVPWDEDGDSDVDGRDFVESAIADHVSLFRVERLALVSAQKEQVDLTLELTSPVTGETVSLHTRVRVGGGS